MITCAICDDEPQAARAIADQLTDYMAGKQITAYSVSCFPSGRALLEQDGFDVVFLDIQMEQPDGLETARSLRRRGDRSLLIFVTILRECVFDAFEVEAYDYLVKPLDTGRFRRTMDRVLSGLERQGTKKLLVRRGADCEVVALAGIVYGEVQGRRIYLHRDGGAVLDYCGRLEDLERQVDRRFFRCHRSYLVNLDHVCGCRAGQVLLSGGAAIPVSRLRERELTQALLRRMRERDF